MAKISKKAIIAGQLYQLANVINIMAASGVTMKKYQSAKKNESVISENGWKANVNVGES
jgi:hypothetical protein